MKNSTLKRPNCNANSLDSSQRFVAFATLCACIAFTLVGCTRDQYRARADQEAYGLLRSRQFDSRWILPDRTVEADPRSRLADINDPDCGPLPHDDPAAECYMHHPYKSKRRVEYWDKRGGGAAIDSESWLQYLPTNEKGEVVIDKQLAVNLALLHNRDFQSQVEQLHVSALALSQNRFEFDLNWFGGNDTTFAANGDGVAAIRNLGSSNNLGFSRNFAAGGQFVANLVNSFTWNLGGNGSSNFAVGNLLFSLTQPLLRGAFRHVRTEGLTQAERNLLYDVRSFARFRREFYLNIVSQYLDLLNAAENVRIEQGNLANLETNLELHYLLADQGEASTIRVDQVFQQFQTGRLALINLEQSLESAEDQFKFLLGLPAKVNIRIEDNLLDSFELNSKDVLELQDKVEQLKRELNEFLPPEEASEEFIEKTYAKVKEYAVQVKTLKEEIDQEYGTWTDKLENSKLPAGAGDEGPDAVDRKQQQQLAERMKKFFLDELDKQINESSKQYEDSLVDLDILTERIDPGETEEKESERVKDWKKLQLLINGQGGLLDRVTTLFVTQNQIRLFLIEINELQIEEDIAVRIALENRLDLMNSRGAVVDSYRQVEIAADQLQSDLDVTASAGLNTDSGVNNAFRFDGDEAQYSLGVAVDGPLNRLGERNGYRIAQLAYQQQRRAYMQDEDSIVNSVRLDLRQLRTNRFSFQIARQQLITATRLVDEAQLNLRQDRGTDSSTTQDLLQALESLRDEKNALIGSWIAYETSRIALFVDLELLQLDEQGVWVNEQENFDRFRSGGNDGDASGAGTEDDSADQPSASFEEIERPDFEEEFAEPPAVEDP